MNPDHQPFAYDVSQHDPPHQPLYLAKMLRRLSEAGNIHTVLDAGCGDGNFAASLAGAGYEVYGIDLADSVEVARGRDVGLFERGSLYDELLYPFEGVDKVDAVISVEVIEHLYSPRQFVERAAEAIRPGGRLIITTPYWGYWKTLALAIFGRVDRLHTAQWDGGHIKHWSRKTLTSLVQEQPFRLVAFDGADGRRPPYFWSGMMLTFDRR